MIATYVGPGAPPWQLCLILIVVSVVVALRDVGRDRARPRHPAALCTGVRLRLSGVVIHDTTPLPHPRSDPNPRRSMTTIPTVEHQVPDNYRRACDLVMAWLDDHDAIAKGSTTDDVVRSWGRYKHAPAVDPIVRPVSDEHEYAFDLLAALYSTDLEDVPLQGIFREGGTLVHLVVIALSIVGEVGDAR